MKRLLGISACVLWCASLWGQAGAVSQIDGTIRDATGSVVPGAAIVITQTETGFSRSAESGANGTYVLPSLPVGPYRLEVKKTGFNSYVQQGIVLQVNSSPTIDVALTVGTVSEQVLVEAAAAMVETTSTGVGQVVDQRRVVDLPLNGRIPTELITLTGAAVAVPLANSGQLISQKNYPNAVAISVAGGPANGLFYALDGSTHNDPVNNAGLPLPFPDALQEFKVETSALPAQYGQHAGGAINAVTKSGANAFHGDAFEFIRNRALTTRNFFATSPDTLRRHQFGGTLGGPIVKNKLFFFAGYQQTLQKSDASKNQAFLPTPEALQGDFRVLASAACNSGRAITLGAPFVGNQVAPSLFSPAAVKMMQIYQQPVDACGKAFYNTISNFSEYAGIAKVDWQVSTNHTAFIRYLAAHSISPISYTGNPLSVIDASPDNLVNSVTIGETWVVNAGMVNTFRANFNRAAVNKTQITTLTAKDLGIPLTPPPTPNNLNVVVSGAFNSVGQNSFAAAVPTQSTQLADDFSVLRGSHQIQFGGNWIRPLQNAFFVGTNAGSFSFSGQATGLPMADFMMGKALSFGQGPGTLDAQVHNYVGLYVQDSWRVSSRLRVNYGLRWEPYIGASVKYGHVTHFERSLYDAGVHSTVYPNAPAGVQYPGDPGFDTNNRPNHIYWPNFAPRLGIVYDPKGDGKMTVRASWGIFTDMPHTLYYDAFGGSAPWGGNVSIPNPVGGFDNPWQGYPGGNPFPYKLDKNTPFLTNLSYLTVPLNLHPTQMQQWNLTVQRQISTNWLTTVSYLGNHTTHMWASQSLNPGVYFAPTSGTTCVINGVTQNPCSSTGNINSRRVLTLANPQQGAYISGLTTLDDGATAGYHAMLASVNHRFSNNYTVLANYTWSHCIADPVSLAIGGSYTNPNNRHFDRGNCGGIDIRHIVNVSAALQSPNFKGRIMHMLGTGWQMSPIVSFRTGSSLVVTTGVDNALNGTGGQRPNFVAGADPYCSGAAKGPNCWLNKAAFASPDAGTFGNLGAYNLYGPNFFNVNVSVSRKFRVPIRDGHNIEIRADAFNVENRVNFNLPTSALNSANFGKITSDLNSAGSSNGSPRIIQLSAKYTF